MADEYIELATDEKFKSLPWSTYLLGEDPYEIDFPIKIIHGFNNLVQDTEINMTYPFLVGLLLIQNNNDKSNYSFFLWGNEKIPTDNLSWDQEGNGRYIVTILYENEYRIKLRIQHDEAYRGILAYLMNSYDKFISSPIKIDITDDEGNSYEWKSNE